MKRRVLKFLIPVFCILALVLVFSITKVSKNDIKSLVKDDIDVVINNVDVPICITAQTVENINDNMWDISLDLNSKIAIVDEEEVQMTELFGISEDELDTIVKTSSFKEFLEDNLTGEVEYVNGEVVITNPYSSEALIVETENVDILNTDNLKEINPVVDDIYVVKYNDAKSTKEAYYELCQNSQIINISRDVKVYASDEEAEVSELNNMNSAWGTAFCGMDMYKKYLNYSNNTNTVRVAVLDTGVYSSHEVFKGTDYGDRIDYTYAHNYISNNTNVTDDNGHGTAVAGVIAEATPNNVKIVPIKVMDDKGRGYLSAVFSGIGAVYQNVDVINISLGSKISDVSPNNQTMYDSTLRRARNAGVIVCCAAGNSANEGVTAVEYPAASDYAYGVAAIDEDKQRCDFSNYGSSINYSMPGHNIVLPGITGQDAYVLTSGTSFASPCLAAAAALVKLEHPDYTFDQVDAELTKNVVDLGNTGKDIYYGKGYVDFNVDKFAKPVFISAATTMTEWSTYNRIKISAMDSVNITNYSITNSSNTPSTSEWKTTNSNTFIDVTYETRIPGTNYVWLKDSDGRVAYKQVQVDNIDVINPGLISEIELLDLSKTSFKVQTKFNDSESGLSRVEWHLEDASGQEIAYLVEQSEPIGTNNNVTFSREFKNLTVNSKYTVYAIAYDVVGNMKATKTFTVTTNKADVNVFFSDNGTTKLEVEENENIENILNTKKQEFEAAKTRIYNKNLSENNEKVIFEETDSLFVNTANEISYPIIEDEKLYENYSSDIKYYTLNYKICYIKKKINLNSLKDITINYGDSDVSVGKMNISKNKFSVTPNDNNIANILVDDNSNILVSSNNYAGSTQITIDIEETLTLAHVTKTINVEVKPITIRVKSATLDEKVYDGENEVNVLDVIFEGVLDKDKLEIKKDYTVLALFDTPEVGEDKTVYISVALTKTNLANSYIIENENITMKGTIKAGMSFLKGDINEDGKINADDAADAIEIFKTNAQTVENLAKGDMNNDGRVNAEDAALIIEYFKTHG